MYPCDNGNKKVTAFPPRDIVYKQDNQLFGLRDKPITKQDALPKFEDQPKYLPRQDPLFLASLLVEGWYCMRKVRFSGGVQVCSIGALEDKRRKMTNIAPIPAYTWTLEPAVSSPKGPPMVADLLQHSWAQNRQIAKKTNEEDILLPTWHSSAAAVPNVKRIFPYSFGAQHPRTPL
ncbi:hypothetical protein V6N13_015159 [Hibiscus sabdariffa]